MKSPAFSLDYFPSFMAACSVLDAKASKAVITGSSKANIYKRGSMDSTNELSINSSLPDDSLTSLSTRLSPPNSLRRSSRSALHSMANSPEQRQRRYRSSAANLHIPFNMSASTSPPDPNRIIEAEGELSTSAPSGGITWGMNTVLHTKANADTGSLRMQRVSNNDNSVRSRSGYSTQNSQYSIDSENDDFEKSTFARTRNVGHVSKNYNISVTLKNQNYFDEEAAVSAPLLDPHREFRYKSYRRSYAHLLSIWGLTMQSCELLKFNGLRSNWAEEWPLSKAADNKITKNSTNGGNTAISGLHTSAAKDDALQVSIVCPDCGSGTNYAEGKTQISGRKLRDRCVSCLRYAAKIQCSVCWEPIRGLYKICIECGHATHADCAMANSLDFFGSEFAMLCETGCGCNCAAQNRPFSSLQILVRDEDLRKKRSATLSKQEMNTKREQDKKRRSMARKASGAGLSRGLRQSFVMAVKGGR